MDQFNDIILKNQNIEAHRQCGNCKRTYKFSNIKKDYPEFILIAQENTFLQGSDELSGRRIH